MSEFDFLNMVVLPIFFGLLGFVEPCSIGSTLVLVKQPEGREAHEKIAWSMNRRSRLTGIATGDQAMFVRRQAFATVGGFPELPLMEDIALPRSLKCLGRPLCLRERAITSGRRWKQRGVLRTIVIMWRLRAGYWLGVDQGRLAQAYASASRER